MYSGGASKVRSVRGYVIYDISFGARLKLG